MKQKSQSVSKTSPPTGQGDVRTARTRAGIDSAFVALLFTRPYIDIRVSDICKKAAIGRATFYAHYQSKDELLQSQLVRIAMPMIQPGRPPSFLDCRMFFAHIRSAPQLFRSLMSGGEGSGSRAVRAALEVRLEQILINQLPQPVSLPAPLVKRFVISTLLAVTAHGLQPNAVESSHEMQRQFEKLVGAGLSA